MVYSWATLGTRRCRNYGPGAHKVRGATENTEPRLSRFRAVRVARCSAVAVRRTVRRAIRRRESTPREVTTRAHQRVPREPDRRPHSAQTGIPRPLRRCAAARGPDGAPRRTSASPPCRRTARCAGRRRRPMPWHQPVPGCERTTRAAPPARAMSGCRSDAAVAAKVPSGGILGCGPEQRPPLHHPNMHG
jgi:hypothetical protein